MILCKLILFRINLEVHFNIVILNSEPLFFNPFQASLAEDSRIA